MKIYVTFHNFEHLDQAFLRESISQTPVMQGWHWIEWDVVHRDASPDISLIYANDLSWREAAKVSNLAPGKCVVLVGTGSPQIGLPIVPFTFKWSELPSLTGIEKLAFGAKQPILSPVRFAPTIPGSVTCLVPS